MTELVLPAIERSGPVEAWIIDDTGFPKKGRHSVGVTRQYCGQLGKQDLSEPALAKAGVAVTLSLANRDASLPVAYRLYLPEDWAKDQARRHKAKIPETIAFQTKPEIALEQINAAQAAGLPQGVVLMDAGYGNDTRLRTEITARGMSYVAGIGPNTSVWPPGVEPLQPQRGRGSGRPPKLLRRDDQHRPIAAKPAPGSNRGRSLSACRKRGGKPSGGAKAARTGSLHGSHGCGCGRGPSAHGLVPWRTATTCWPNRAPKSGC